MEILLVEKISGELVTLRQNYIHGVDTNNPSYIIRKKSGAISRIVTEDILTACLPESYEIVGVL